MISVHSKNQVIPLPISGEIFLRVINDVVCTNRAHDVHIPRAAYGSHFSPKRFGKLHRKRTDTSRRTMNQNLLPLLPTPSTRPAMSDPSIVCFGLRSPKPMKRIKNGLARRRCQSPALTEVA